jgi:hypothetical protein
MELGKRCLCCRHVEPFDCGRSVLTTRAPKSVEIELVVGEAFMGGKRIPLASSGRGGGDPRPRTNSSTNIIAGPQ